MSKRLQAEDECRALNEPQTDHRELTIESARMLPEVVNTHPEVVVQCPTCGAGGQTAAECRRCRTDLRLLHRLEGHRTAEFKELARALAEGRWSDALLSAQYIHRLRSDEISFRLLAVCQVLNNQLDLACATHRQCRDRFRTEPGG